MRTLSVSPDAEELDSNQGDHENCYPDANVDVPGTSPELDRDAGSSDLKGQNQQQAKGILPAYTEAPDGLLAVEKKYMPLLRAYQAGSMKRTM